MSQPPLIPQQTTLRTLEAHLWEAANILRGSPVDRTDWKSYILPLLFFKRICDVWDEEYAETRRKYGEDFADEHRFQIPEGCHWNDVRATPSNVGRGAAERHARDRGGQPEAPLRGVRRRAVDQQGPPARRAAQGPDRALLGLAAGQPARAPATSSATPTST